MVNIIAKVTIKKEKIEEFKSVGAELVEASRKDLGCVSYQLFQDKRNEDEFTFIEEWESQELLDSHGEQVAKNFPQLGEFFASDLVIIPLCLIK